MVVELWSKEWANEILRYSIAVLQGKRIISRPEGRLLIARVMRNRLAEAGFWWQADKLEHHIHRFYKSRRDLSLQGEQATSSRG